MPTGSTGCFVPRQGRVWARGYGSWNSQDGDDEAPGYDEHLLGLVVGYDYAFNENWFAGSRRRLSRLGTWTSTGWGGRPGAAIDYDGWQVAAYGGYDNSVVYARGILAYGWYDGDSSREIANPDVAGNLTGKPRLACLSFYGETGYRLR